MDHKAILTKQAHDLAVQMQGTNNAHSDVAVLRAPIHILQSDLVSYMQTVPVGSLMSDEVINTIIGIVRDHITKNTHQSFTIRGTS